MSVKAWPCQHLVLFFRFYKISQNEEQTKDEILANQIMFFWGAMRRWIIKEKKKNQDELNHLILIKYH